MTLITRIITASSVYIASDDQLNAPSGVKYYGVSKMKSFRFDKTIGAVSGFVQSGSTFDIMEKISKYDNYENLIAGILNDIPKNLHSRQSLILLSEHTYETIMNYSILIQNGSLEEKEFVESFYIKNFESDFFSKQIEDCYDSSFYKNHLDFNWSYEESYNNRMSVFHSLFHFKLYEKYSKSTLERLIHDTDNNIVDFLVEFYSFIDSLKPHGKREPVKKYYNILKTIGECNSILKLDIETGANILYAKE